MSSSWIQWNWPAVPGATKYHVYNAATGLLQATIDAPTTAWDQQGLTPNSAHAIRVSGSNAGGEGPLSDCTTSYTWAEIPTADSHPPFSSSNSVTAFWGQANNPLGTTYDMMVSSAIGVSAGSTTVTANAVGPVQGTVSDLPPSELFAIYARAINHLGVPTAWFTITGSSVATLPDAPSNLVVSGTGPSDIAVSWDNGRQSSSSTYEVTYASVDVGGAQAGNWLIYGSTSLSFLQGRNVNAWVVSGLQTSTTYTIRVRAKNSLGNTSVYVSTNGMTFGNGAPLGTLAGTLSATKTTMITGTVNINDPRTVTLRSPAGAFPSDLRVMISTFAPPACGLCKIGRASCRERVS
jgi:hypothetical protein